MLSFLTCRTVMLLGAGLFNDLDQVSILLPVCVLMYVCSLWVFMMVQTSLDDCDSVKIQYADHTVHVWTVPTERTDDVDRQVCFAIAICCGRAYVCVY